VVGALPQTPTGELISPHNSSSLRGRRAGKGEEREGQGRRGGKGR